MCAFGIGMKYYNDAILSRGMPWHVSPHLQTLALVRYDMIIDDSVLSASLTVYHLTSDAHLWNNKYNNCITGIFTPSYCQVGDISSGSIENHDKLAVKIHPFNKHPREQRNV